MKMNVNVVKVVELPHKAGWNGMMGMYQNHGSPPQPTTYIREHASQMVKV